MLFSLQMYSSSSVSAWNASGWVTVHGFVYAFGSSIVIWMSRFPKSLRMNRSVTRS